MLVHAFWCVNVCAFLYVFMLSYVQISTCTTLTMHVFRCFRQWMHVTQRAWQGKCSHKGCTKPATDGMHAYAACVETNTVYTGVECLLPGCEDHNKCMQSLLYVAAIAPGSVMITMHSRRSV